MHLISATIRNYRLHRERTVAFDRARNLIGGPNEAGKSTLIEAIHRGLFLRSRTGGEVQRSMISTLPGAAGHPEVEIRFHAGGSDYHLSKRFSGGQTGTTTLTQAGGKAWTGEDAEARLASLLGLDALVGGHGAANKLAQQWAHLWIWQGKSGEDPCAHAGAEHANLLRRLQESGGAVAMQSACDSRVASQFSEQVATIFTSKGKAKQGSGLQQAEAAVSEAEIKHRQAAERVASLQQAVTRYETASSTILRVKEDLRKVDAERAEVAAKLRQVEKLIAREKLEQAHAESAAKQYGMLQAADRQIAGLVEAIAEGEKRLAPETEELTKLEVRASELATNEKSREEAFSKAGEQSRSARLRREWGAATVKLFERKAAVSELSDKVAQIRERQQQATALRGKMAELPKVDDAKLKKLQSLENALGTAEVALKAMAAGVEVISADGEVRVGGSSLSAGEHTTVAETTEIAFGESFRLRIHPGGGDSLAGARREVSQSRDKLRAALDEVGLPDVAAASEACRRIAELQKKIDHEETILKGMDAAKTPARLGEAEEEQTAAQAEADRRKESISVDEEPADLEQARALLAKLENEFQEAESAEKEARIAFTAAQKASREGAEKFKQATEVVAREQRELDASKAQLRLLLETHGADDVRKGKLEEAAADRKTQEEALNLTRKALADLQPEQLQRSVARLDRSLAMGREQLEDAKQQQIEARTILHSNGGEDPAADLAHAQARLESARHHLENTRRKAEAFRLLDHLFTEEQQALADQFTRPLVEKVSGYLQCLFGPDARAAMTFGEDSFSALQLVRGGNGAGATSFDSLSGGAREQVAAAVRLAMAEVLAADHGGCLPIVFDDAFAYSDPVRVKTLQRMLDLAAERGLQVIVLTCNPSDYAGLGAKSTILPPPTETRGDSLNASGSETGSDADPIASAPKEESLTL